MMACLPTDMNSFILISRPNIKRRRVMPNSPRSSMTFVFWIWKNLEDQLLFLLICKLEESAVLGIGKPLPKKQPDK